MNEDKKNIIDWQACLQRAQGKTNVADELLGMFINDSKTLAKLIQNCDDLEQLKQAVHKLRGGASYVSVPNLKAMLDDLDEVKDETFNENWKLNKPKLAQQLQAVLVCFNESNYK